MRDVKTPIRRYHRLAIVLFVAIVGGGIAYSIADLGGGDAQSQGRPPELLETVRLRDIGVPGLYFEDATGKAAGVLTMEAATDAYDKIRSWPLKEDPKLLFVRETSSPSAPGSEGPFWVFSVDGPYGGTVDPPPGTKIWLLIFIDARTGDWVMEWSGPIIDGENEWDPDFPKEYRYPPAVQ